MSAAKALLIGGRPGDEGAPAGTVRAPADARPVAGGAHKAVTATGRAAPHF